MHHHTRPSIENCFSPSSNKMKIQFGVPFALKVLVDGARDDRREGKEKIPNNKLQWFCHCVRRVLIYCAVYTKK